MTTHRRRSPPVLAVLALAMAGTSDDHVAPACAFPASTYTGIGEYATPVARHDPPYALTAFGYVGPATLMRMAPPRRGIPAPNRFTALIRHHA